MENGNEGTGPRDTAFKNLSVISRNAMVRPWASLTRGEMRGLAYELRGLAAQLQGRANDEARWGQALADRQMEETADEQSPT